MPLAYFVAATDENAQGQESPYHAVFPRANGPHNSRPVFPRQSASAALLLYCHPADTAAG